MKGSSTQLLQVGVRSVEGHTQRITSKASRNKGMENSCAFPNVMLSICNGISEFQKPDMTNGKVLLSLCNKKMTAAKNKEVAGDLLLSSDIGSNHRVNEDISNQEECVVTKHGEGQKQTKIKTVNPVIQSAVKSTADVKHPVLNVPLNNHFGWNITDVKPAPTKSSRVGNHHFSENNLAAIRGIKPKIAAHNDGMKFPMMWFEAKMWTGIDNPLLKPEIMPNSGWSRYDALIKNYSNVIANRVTLNTTGSIANEAPDTNVQEITLTMKDPEISQNSTANKQRMQNPAPNPNAEPSSSNSKETVNIATSSENAKPIKEAVDVNNTRKPVSKSTSVADEGNENVGKEATGTNDTRKPVSKSTSVADEGNRNVGKEATGTNDTRKPVSTISSAIGEGNKKAGKAKSSAHSQQHIGAKASGEEVSEASMKSKQAGKLQISGNPNVVKAVEEGARSKAGIRIEGVASPVSGVSSSNGQAAPVNNVTAPSRSRWDSLMQFVQRIMQNAHIQHRQEGLSELRVRMASETLGKLTVHVSVIDNNVDVRFALDTLQARQVMQSHKAELTQLLKDTGASSVNIDVTTSSTDSEERFRQFSDAGDRYGHPDFHSGLAIDDNWSYTEGLDQESELASPATRVNLPYEHSSMVWVA